MMQVMCWWLESAVLHRCLQKLKELMEVLALRAVSFSNEL